MAKDIYAESKGRSAVPSGEFTMEFKQIEAFVNVVKYKSFSKAAEVTYLTQPTISVHIRALESELGAILLDRQGRYVVPTAKGRIFYKYAQDLLTTREKMMGTFLDMNAELRGRLDIQTSSTPGQDFVPWIIKRFADKHTKVHYSIEQSDSEQVIENIVGGKGEIGFVGSTGSKELSYIKIFETEPRLITSENRPSGKIEGDTISIEDFIAEPFLWREQGEASRQHFEMALLDHGYGENALNIIARINSIGVVRKCVATGLGVSLVSSSAIGEKDYLMGIKSYKIKEYSGHRAFYMVYRKKGYLSPIAEKFKEFVIDQSAKYGQD